MLMKEGVVSWGLVVLTRSSPVEGNSVESVVVPPFLTKFWSFINIYHTG